MQVGWHPQLVWTFFEVKGIRTGQAGSQAGGSDCQFATRRKLGSVRRRWVGTDGWTGWH
jgi:hypothetical protein